jgi:hypothetical protein
VNQNISVVGRRGTPNNCTLDGGGADTDPDFNVYIRISSIDALQEFKVVSGMRSSDARRRRSTSRLSPGPMTFEFLRDIDLAAKPFRLPCYQSCKSSPARRQSGVLRRRYAQDYAQAGAHRRLAMGNDPALARYDAEHDQIQYASPQGVQAKPIRYPVFVRAGTHG